MKRIIMSSAAVLAVMAVFSFTESPDAIVYRDNPSGEEPLCILETECTLAVGNPCGHATYNTKPANNSLPCTSIANFKKP
jgi:hypothetical protein